MLGSSVERSRVPIIPSTGAGLASSRHTPRLTHASPAKEKKTRARSESCKTIAAPLLDPRPGPRGEPRRHRLQNSGALGPGGRLAPLAFPLDGKSRLPLNPFPKPFSTRQCLTKPSLRDRTARMSIEIRVLRTPRLSLQKVFFYQMQM